jgi:hypothetical protein
MMFYFHRDFLDILNTKKGVVNIIAIFVLQNWISCVFVDALSNLKFQL